MADVREVASGVRRDAKLGELAEIIEQGQKLHRKVGNGRSELTDEAAQKYLSIDLAKYPIDFLQEFVDAINDEQEEHEDLDDRDLRVVEAVLIFMQKVGSNSLRSLLQFFEAVNEGDYSYLCIQACGQKREIRVRSYLSQAAMQEFGFE